MPPKNLIQAFFEYPGFHWSLQTHDVRNVVERVLRLKLVQEPEPLLRKREQRLGVPLRWRERGKSKRRILSAQMFDLLRQAGDSWSFKQHAQRQVYPKSLAHARDDLRSKERVSS